MNVKWKPFNPDKRRKWYFLEDELVHIEHLHSRIVFEKLENFPKIDCFDEEEVTCDACRGHGEVYFEFNHGMKIYTQYGECPVCEGEGVVVGKSKTPNGKKDYDYKKSFKIGDCNFLVDRVLELLFVAKTLNSDIKVIHKTDGNNQMVFQIDDVTLILMPSIRTDLSVAQTIEI